MRFTDEPSIEDRYCYVAGYESVKSAAEAQPVYALEGRLYASKSGWILLSIPNAMIRGIFDALNEPGAELPLSHGAFNAHLSVMRPDEVERIGGVDKVSERGHMYRFQIGPIKCVEPAGWKEMSKVWFVSIESPELKTLRRSYGLPSLPHRDGEELPFHATVAVRRKNVLYSGEARKAAEAEPFHGHTKYSCGHETRCRCREGSHNERQLDDPCYDCQQEKLAVLSYALNALKDEPIRYDVEKGVLQNIFSHLQNVQARGSRAAAEVGTFERMKSNLDPNYATQRFMRHLSGRPDPGAPTQADQFLLGFPLDRLQSAF